MRRVVHASVLVAAACPMFAQPVEVEPAAFARFADSVIAAEMARRQIPGAAFVFVRNGEVRYSRGYGVANLETRRAVSPESTLFRIGSISKLFTATAVMQLVDSGRVSLTTDVNRYLTALQVPATFAAPITPLHLLSHTSGLDEIRPGTQASSEAGLLDLAEFLRTRLHRVRPPGEVPSYSTYGMTLAGLLVEQVSGRSYEEYLRERVWGPLGMTQTAITLPPPLRARLATAYEYRNGRYEEQRYEWYHTAPASSINATALDMARFLIAHLEGGGLAGHRILSEAAARAMKQPHGRGHPEIPGFAIGFFEGDLAGVRVVEHQGAVAGVSSALVLFPEARAGFFVASQREANGLGDVLKAAIISRYFAPAARRSPSVLFPGENSRFAGRYRWNVYCHSCGQPAPTMGPEVTLLPGGGIGFAGSEWHRIGPLHFESRDGNRRLGFRENAAGDITHLFIDGPVTFERVP